MDSRSCDGNVQLLQAAKFNNGTGANCAKAVVEALRDWRLDDKVGALTFDTTTSNTGKNTGAYVLIEQELERSLPYLACRHHVLEFLVSAVLTKVLGQSLVTRGSALQEIQGPVKFVNQEDYDHVMSDPNAREIVEEDADSLIEFCKNA